MVLNRPRTFSAISTRSGGITSICSKSSSRRFSILVSIWRVLIGSNKSRDQLKIKKTEKQATTKVTACLKQRLITKYKNKSITNSDNVWSYGQAPGNATEVVCSRRSISKTGREKKPRDSGGGEKKLRRFGSGTLSNPTHTSLVLSSDHHRTTSTMWMPGTGYN